MVQKVGQLFVNSVYLVKEIIGRAKHSAKSVHRGGFPLRRPLLPSLVNRAKLDFIPTKPGNCFAMVAK
jgi:hypothetical protein